jgi:cell division septation protein DedD
MNGVIRIIGGVALLTVVGVLRVPAQQGGVQPAKMLAENREHVTAVADVRKPADLFLAKIQPAFMEQPGVTYSIQMGAFTRRDNAVKLSRRLGGGGYRTEVLENLIDGKQLLYLVWVGSYRSMDDVMKTLVTLRLEYQIDGVVRERTVCRR